LTISTVTPIKFPVVVVGCSKYIEAKIGRLVGLKFNAKI
jgi:hypothetical protein